MKLCAVALSLLLAFILCACSTAESVIIDTDIGSKAGDALALAWAARSQKIKLIGVTTIGSGAVERAKIAATVLADAGLKKVPVVSGETGGSAPVFYDAALYGQAEVDFSGAAAFITEKAKSTAKGITLICTGPLTNAAKAVADPEVARKIRRIIICGGKYYSHGIEPNIAADPMAAKVVFDSGIPIIAAGEDVTRLCILDEKQKAKLAESEKSLGKLIFSQIKAEAARGDVILQDLAAVAVLVESNLVVLEDKHIVIETGGTITRGMTFNETDAVAPQLTVFNASVAKSIKAKRIVAKALSSVLSGE